MKRAVLLALSTFRVGAHRTVHMLSSIVAQKLASLVASLVASGKLASLYFEASPSRVCQP